MPLPTATGEANPASLAARFEIDIRAPEFWRASLALIHKDIDRFERLAGNAVRGELAEPVKQAQIG